MEGMIAMDWLFSCSRVCQVTDIFAIAIFKLLI